MSDIIKKALTKQDFCKPDCSCDGWKNIIYPETSADQIYLGGLKLDTWIGGGSAFNTLEKYIQSLVPSQYTLPPATTSSLGGIIVGSGLAITSQGVLSVTGGGGSGEVAPASVFNLGGIKLFNDNYNIPDANTSTNPCTSWEDWDLTNWISMGIRLYEGSGETEIDPSFGDFCRALPVLTTKDITTGHYRAYVPFPDSWLDLATFPEYIAGTHISFDENDNEITINGDDFIFDFNKDFKLVNDPDNPGVASTVHMSGDNYVLLGNKTLENGNGNLGEDGSGNVSLAYGFPRFALVSGKGIQFDMYTDGFQTSNPWYGTAGNHLSELLITLCQASNDELGGIKIGYSSNGTKRPVVLDANGKAYVDISNVPAAAHLMSNELSMHSFLINHTSGLEVQAGMYIPLIDSVSTNNDKRSILFEIIGREDSGTYYAKYYFNTAAKNSEKRLVCLDFYSDNETLFSHSDIVAALSDTNTWTIYKLNHGTFVSGNLAAEMFVINVLAENDTTYSTQHYYYTGTASSIAEPGYSLTTQMIVSGPLLSSINSETYHTHDNVTVSSNPSAITFDVKANQKYQYTVNYDTTVTLTSIEDSRHESIIIIKAGDSVSTGLEYSFSLPIGVIAIGKDEAEASDDTYNNRIIYISHNIVKFEKF